MGRLLSVNFTFQRQIEEAKLFLKKPCINYVLRAALAQWIRMHLPSFDPTAPGSYSKHKLLRIAYLICHRIVIRMKINKKYAGVGPFKNKIRTCLASVTHFLSLEQILEERLNLLSTFEQISKYFDFK